MNDAGPCLPDPSSRLEKAYRAVAIRMAGLSFVNPAIEVEAIAFAPWESHWLGVMLTPWFMNLMMVPRLGDVRRVRATGAKRRYAFPAGTYEFVGGYDDEIGGYQSCSLYSPLLQFDDHASARLVATLAREALFDTANAESPSVPDANRSAGNTIAEVRTMAGLAAAVAAPLSKRDFLRGRITGSRRADRG